MDSNSARTEPDSPATPRLSDDEAVERVLAGDLAVFEVIMRRYNQRLFRIARAVLRDDTEAEDVVQEAYVRAYASLSQFAGRSSFATWLAKIAVHESWRRARTAKRFQEKPDNEAGESSSMEFVKASDPDPEQQALRREASSMLESAVDALPDSYRSVFMLREIENMSTADTAECLALTEEAVKVRLLRARRMIREDLYARVGATGSQAFQFMGERCDRVVRGVFERLKQLGAY